MTAPDDPTITLRQIPARQMVPVPYFRFLECKNYLQSTSGLESWIDEKGLTIIGAAM